MVEGTPPGDALPLPPQRAMPARKGARCGTGAGSPDAPRNGGRPPPPGAAPHHPRGTQLPQGMQAKGTVPGPHTRTPAPTACGWRTLTARPEGGQPGDEQRLTRDAPRDGGGPPTQGWPQPPPRSAAPTGHASRGDSAGPSHPHNRAHSKSGWTARPEGGQSGKGERLTADAPPRNPVCPPLRNTGITGHGDSAGPRTCTPVAKAHGQRAPTAPRGGGQPEGGERPASDVPRNAAATDRGGGST